MLEAHIHEQYSATQDAAIAPLLRLLYAANTSVGEPCFGIAAGTTEVIPRPSRKPTRNNACVVFSCELEQEKHLLRRRLDTTQGEYEARLLELQNDIRELTAKIDSRDTSVKQSTLGAKDKQIKSTITINSL
uniref:SFRICE_024032 n=1 Tax=Spodoptera frugiperda TaxID=7108 RepID=A0A2H1VUS6_SPOFR